MCWLFSEELPLVPVKHFQLILADSNHFHNNWPNRLNGESAHTVDNGFSRECTYTRKARQHVSFCVCGCVLYVHFLSICACTCVVACRGIWVLDWVSHCCSHGASSHSQPHTQTQIHTHTDTHTHRHTLVLSSLAASRQMTFSSKCLCPVSSKPLNT